MCVDKPCRFRVYSRAVLFKVCSRDGQHQPQLGTAKRCILRTYPRFTGLDILGAGPGSLCFNKPYRGFECSLTFKIPCSMMIWTNLFLGKSPMSVSTSFWEGLSLNVKFLGAEGAGELGCGHNIQYDNLHLISLFPVGHPTLNYA